MCVGKVRKNYRRQHCQMRNSKWANIYVFNIRFLGDLEGGVQCHEQSIQAKVWGLNKHDTGSVNCHNDTRARANSVQNASLLPHKRGREWASRLNGNGWRDVLPLANQKLLFCASLMPAAWVVSVALHVNTHYQVNPAAWLFAVNPIIIDLLASPWARKRQKHPCQVVRCQKYSFKATSSCHGPLAHSGHLSITLNSKWKCDRWHQSEWKARHGAAPYQLHLLPDRWW